MEINLEELREAERLLDKMAAHMSVILPGLTLLEKMGGRATLSLPVDPLIHRGEVIELLKIGEQNLNKLIAEGKLHPLYVADSTRQKFRLSEVNALPTSTCPKEIVCNLRLHRQKLHA